MNFLKLLPVMASLLLLASPCSLVAGELPAHPDQLTYPELKFDPPAPGQFRHVLSNGVVVYLAPSQELPLVQLQMRFEGGNYLDPVGKEGLVDALGAMMRRGGCSKYSAEELDERLDFLASQVSTSASTYSMSAGMNCLKMNFDESFALLMDIVKTPRFQEDKCVLLKEQVLESMKQRNDNADSILDGEWSRQLYGEDHFAGRDITQSSLDSISIADMKAMHAKLIHPGSLMIAASGDFDVATILGKLEAALSGWEAGPKPAAPPAPVAVVEPGVYHLEKDIPQGKVFIGMRGIKRDDPDALALQVMDRILGAGGFTSRIMRVVRSNEGLAYSARSRMSPGLHFPGQFQASFQSKSSTVALATKLILGEISKIRSTPISAEELATAKNAMVQSFPSVFGANSAIISRYMNDEATGRGYEYYKSYRSRIEALTVEDIQRVASKHLDPAKMMIMVVGRWKEIAPGDMDGRAKMSDFFDGKDIELPLRDPLSLKPISPN